MYYLPRINGNVNGSLERQMEIIDNTKTHGNGNGSYKSGKTNGSITRSQMEIIDNTKVKRRTVKEYVTCVARITPYEPPLPPIQVKNQSKSFLLKRNLFVYTSRIARPSGRNWVGLHDGSVRYGGVGCSFLGKLFSIFKLLCLV